MYRSDIPTLQWLLFQIAKIYVPEIAGKAVIFHILITITLIYDV